MPLKLALIVLPLMAITAARPEGDLLAEYTFDAEGAPGVDSSSNGRDASVEGARRGEGREGGGLTVDGAGGLTIAADPALQAKNTFGITCWVKFDTVSHNMNIISKDDEYVLRIDPANEGSNLSFFVNVGGKLEPRVRGPAPKPDRWYHVAASWDGQYARLWINGRKFEMARAGGIEPADSPVVIAAPVEWGPMGLKGTIDDVRFFARPLRDAQVLAGLYGMGAEAPRGQAGRLRFEFEDQEHGWEARNAELLQVHDGRLVTTVRGTESAVVNSQIDRDIKGKRFIALRMSATAGETGRIVYRTTEGLGSIRFDLIADGRPHSYVFDVGDHGRWLGELIALAVSPSDAEADTEIDFLRVSAEAEAPPELRITRFAAPDAFTRAGQPCELRATVYNAGGKAVNATAKLTTGPDVRVLQEGAADLSPIPHGSEREMTWKVQAEEAGEAEIELEVSGPEDSAVTETVMIDFKRAVDLPEADYVPEPEIAESEHLVGAHYCPLWKQGTRRTGWEQIVPYPKRKPVLGWYDEGDPEVADWEIKWALEHGISYFVYCWYRHSQGEGVQMRLSHAIHEGLFNSRYGSKFKFCIMWENQVRGSSGVASEEDLMDNLLPFWIENYFTHPSYLKIDNKPVLFIYRPEYLIGDLGSIENVRSALGKMGDACREAGFDGLITLGEYRGANERPLETMAEEGVDYAFAYCWHIQSDPEPDRAIRAQEQYWEQWLQMGIIPYVLTVSMGWDSTPWHPSHSKWRLPPDNFAQLCRRAKQFMQRLPEHSLGRRMLLLDNWNEFGEGHYIAPHREYGFGYLDAVRSVFTDAPDDHVDVVPQDVGLGPYDSLFRRYQEVRAMCSKEVMAPGGDEAKLVGWWNFDEPEGTPVAYDVTGNGRGGMLHDITRVDGMRGSALLCEGGSAQVPAGAPKAIDDAMTVECWIRTEAPGQDDKWFVNNVYGDGAAGFRLGLHDGKLSWAIPQTPWSHHLDAGQPVPVGKWVHVAATYNGRTMKLYMDGKECGALARSGYVHQTDSSLCLGNYDQGHRAHFTGLLDEVRIYSRALDEQEIQRRAAGRGGAPQ